MSKLLLGLFFYLVVTPVALVRRIFGDPLRRRWRPNRESYWIDLTPPD